jgi:hypothetical protein
MIKTISITSGEETTVELTGGTHVLVTNRGDSTVYVSKEPNVVADGDGVKAIDGGSVDILRDVGVYVTQDGISDWCGTIYVVADGDTKIQLETTNNVNFRRTSKGGGDGMSNYVTSNNVIAYFDDNTTVYMVTYEEV